MKKSAHEEKLTHDTTTSFEAKLARSFTDAPSYSNIPAISEQKGEKFTWAPTAPRDRSWMAADLVGGSKVGGERSNPVTKRKPSPEPNFSRGNILARDTARKSVILNLTPDENLTGRLGLTVQAFQEFGTMTTFHGLRYMLAPDTNLIRRFLWLLLVILCFVIVSLQLLVQYKHYISKPTSINVDKIYTDYTEFPSVTICNDNVFRISAAHNEGLMIVLKKLYDNQLTLDDVYGAGVANVTMDQLNFKAGNRIDNMLLRCKWHEINECGAQNFSTTMTDYGLCFTFNGPDYHSVLRVTSPGASYGLELVLNIEEYERMAGPNVGSGIHIFVQNKRDYPLVEQKGQAIAAGSHAFISLTHKKEKRLGEPYDNCQNWRMEHVSSKTYRYSMATCQVDCYVTFVVNKCGCKDFYLPGNFPVCNLGTFVTCLKDARNEYDAIKDKVCECYNPCQSEYLEPLYSYSALSKDVHHVLGPGETDRILNRFKWSLDINEYYNTENQYKKSRYRNFTQSVNRLQEFYDIVFEERILRLMNNLIKVRAQSSLITLMSEELLDTQACIYEETFLQSTQVNDLELIKELAEDHTNFGMAVVYKTEYMRPKNKQSIRNIMYSLLKADITERLNTIDHGFDLIYKLTKVLEDMPDIKKKTDCVGHRYFEGIDPNEIMPRDTLKEALSRSSARLESGNYTRNILRESTFLLKQLMEVTKQVYENVTFPRDDDPIEIITKNYSMSSISYLFEHDEFVRETVKWPSRRLKQRREQIASMNKECETKLSDYVDELNMTHKGLLNVKEYIKEYKKIIPILIDYLKHFNVSKFRIAELFNERNSEEVWVWMEEMRVSMSARLDNYMHHLTKVLECYTNLYKDIFASADVFYAYEVKGIDFNVSQTFRETLFNDTFDSLYSLKAIRIIRDLHTEHLALARDIQLDANQFSNQAIIDVTFYSKNFIFLNIFFSEISYTITEQQVAYGDIGGSMGLLIGGSIVSLFEILDFVICLCVSLVRWTP